MVVIRWKDLFERLEAAIDACIEQALAHAPCKSNDPSGAQSNSDFAKDLLVNKIL